MTNIFNGVPNTTGGTYTTLPYTSYGPATYTYPVSITSPYQMSSAKAGDIYWHDIPEYFGPSFVLNGPVWSRSDIILKSELKLHYKRFAVINETTDHGVVGNVAGGELLIHPAFSSEKTFDLFNAWWGDYSKRFASDDMETTVYPTLPCGGHSNVSIMKSESPEEEFRKFYGSLTGNIWFENGKWIFSHDADAVMAKMRIAK